MDRDNEIPCMFSSSGTPRVSVTPDLRLKRLPDRLSEPLFTTRPTRVRRVVAYTPARRSPGPAIAAIGPADTGPAEVNPFDMPTGETAERRCDPAKLRRISSISQGPEPAA
ncbi:hypothetical protein AB0K02_23455 [Streptomyces sp. NPDC049597]|uniref:hypothetical protein n=1 Tax=Streptomyces sp. NPDC049597 TaxID=3155276 RepID=UPI0034195934